jgi:tetratricopeptide (TPR) repeat protein
MPNDEPPPRRRVRDVDISRPLWSQWLRPKVNWVWLIVCVVATFVFFALNEQIVRLGWWIMLLPAALVLLFAAWLAWQLIVRRGVFTWMRLATLPARMMARGDAEGAERALGKALARARRFAPDDHRRGLMLLELAGYVKNQGRYAEAEALFEEGVGILAHHERSNPLDYFIALNNYAICFIHLRDHAAAQRMLERALDLTLVRSKGGQTSFAVTPVTAGGLELVLHLNLVFLFIEMHELAEAEDQMEEAEVIFDRPGKARRMRFGDHYRAIRALLRFAQGRFADAADELDQARNPNYPACLRARAKLDLVRQAFAEAEQGLRKYLDVERKKGPLRRPELRDCWLDLAESLFGQGKHDEAVTAFQEARSIVAQFALPAGLEWRRALERWLSRGRERGRAELVVGLEAELQALRAVPQQGIAVSDRLRVRPPAP